ncbi:MAG: imidazole glycerol phosphate synthase subunit HisH [Eubacteriaceae bacterium]|jgi:glutamine amidotransferase|nr:imidazole glycerol phosphate synthase subunit HisH [Eubacteriaceae bacterium]
MSIAIIDYDVGNLKNVHTALKDVQLDSVITRDPQVMDDASAIILPGVGAFADAMANLNKYHLLEPLKKNVKKGKMLLGICLGMQILFDESSEDGQHQGLGFIPGKVTRFDVPGLTVPHMGWNNLVVNREDPIVSGITSEDYVYFVHSYYAVLDHFDSDVVAYAEYALKVPAIVRKDNVIGMQFHPEKSAETGTRLLRNLKECIQ